MQFLEKLDTIKRKNTPKNAKYNSTKEMRRKFFDARKTFFFSCKRYEKLSPRIFHRLSTFIHYIPSIYLSADILKQLINDNDYEKLQFPHEFAIICITSTLDDEMNTKTNRVAGRSELLSQIQITIQNISEPSGVNYVKKKKTSLQK